jgi:hypothetical protein
MATLKAQAQRAEETLAAIRRRLDELADERADGQV